MRSVSNPLFIPPPLTVVYINIRLYRVIELCFFRIEISRHSAETKAVSLGKIGSEVTHPNMGKGWIVKLDNAETSPLSRLVNASTRTTLAPS